MLEAQAVSDQPLSAEAIRAALDKGLARKFSGKNVLVLIPDHTRSIPLPQLFRMMVEVLSDAGKLDFMVALGTHPPLDEAALLKLVGISHDERLTHYGWVGLHNHTWDQADSLEQIGVLTLDRIKEIAGAAWHPSLGGDVPVRINKHVKEYDRVIILGPTFPHEVVGFSGGAKYLFPGISGPEMINVTHWLGALLTSTKIIGTKDTPVRAMINAAADMVKTPITLVSLVVVPDGLAGIFVGDLREAWSAAADLSSNRHINWVAKPYQRVLAWAPSMYDELWTAGKAMYKTDPVVADGGEIIIFAPHLNMVSRVHGKHIMEIGYHPLDYFLKQWDKFKHVPLGVLAHSTHVRGGGTFENGVEKPRIKVTLASQISAEDCRKLSLGYLDPATVRIEQWQGKEAEGWLYVPKAGEMLYRVKK
ncbi:MAG: lactate racemase domain-containing protein [Anaerolineae bacterium]